MDSENVDVLSKRYDDQEEDEEEVVGVRQRNVMACTFHPELCDDDVIKSWHKYFVSCTLKYKHS